MSEPSVSSLSEHSLSSAAATEEAVSLAVPEELQGNMLLFLRLVRKVLNEYDAELLSIFDELLADAIRANSEDAAETDDEREAFSDAVRIIDSLPVERATILMRAFTVYFHLANICEENYRVTSLRDREATVPTDQPEDPINDLTVAYHRLVDECGRGKAIALLNRLEFRPVFTAHPTEAAP